MRRPSLNLLLIVTLAVSLSPAAWAMPVIAAAAISAPAGPPAVAPTAQPRQAPPHLEEVPEEIRALFADGMSVEDFVAMVGTVPRALEDFVEGDALMIIELEGDPVAAQVAAQKGTLRPMSVGAVERAMASLERAQSRLRPQLVDLGVQIISNYTVVYNGFQALVPLNQLDAIRALPGVKAVHRAPIHRPALGTSVDLIGASDVWQDLGVDGDGITIAIIDTGIDYTHAAFGGPGTPLAYSLNNPDVVEPNTFPTAKVIGGYDFAGTTYNANPSDAAYQPIPHPDPDPLDEHYHGTHVASIAAGLAAGDVMTGTAPGATLMALKVFGRDGSTALVADALEWATLQYIYTGKPEVINMSLGSNFGTGGEADPSVAATNNAAGVGIVVVASAGNAYDSSYITGSPATADRAISVAASEDGFSILDGFEVTKPASLEGVHPALQSVNYDWTSPDLPITGKLVYPEVGANPAQDQRTGCYTFNITNTTMIAGNIVLLDWNTPSCGGSVGRSANAVAAGAIGILMADDSDVFDLYIAGSSVVPAYSIPLPIGDALKAALGAGEVEVVLTAEHEASVPYAEPAAEDIIAAFSSRGPRGTDSFLKPEITAPGGSIFAANAGTGVGGLSIGGTSMAAPHIAGVAALMVQANPTWTPEEVKAAMMNTAVDLVDGTPIPRSGAGRVDAYRAVDTEAIAVGDVDLVSLNYGVIFSRNDSVSRAKHVSVTNQSATNQTYDVGWALQSGSNTAGAMMTVQPSQIMLAAGESAVVTVTLMLDLTETVAEFWEVEEYYGFVTLSPVHYRIYLPIIFSSGGGETSAAGQATVASTADGRLRVPFYFQARPYSQLTLEADSADPVTDYVTISMTHQGPISSSTWIYPALIWNDAPDPSMTGPGDVRLFGMDWGWTSGAYGDILAVAINTWDYWHVPQPYFAEFDLYIDADQDGTPDYVNFNFNLGIVTTGISDNTWIILQVDLATNMLYLASPYLIYTDYNASYMEWYLPAVWQDLGPSDPSFDYLLVSYDEEGVGVNGPGRFNYRRSPLGWFIPDDPGPAEREALAYAWVDDLPGYLYSEPQGVMLVDYNGDPRNVNGSQAYFVPIELTAAYVQVAHLAPFAEDASVTIALNGMDALTGFEYGDSTGYIPLPPGEYLVEVTPTGETTVAISATVEVEALTFYTVVAVGDGVNQDLALMALVDDLTPPEPGTFHLRLGHLAPFAAGAATADIRLQDGTPVLTGVDFGDVTGFLPLPAGTYDLKITTPGGGTTLIDPLPVTFTEGQIVSAFATGEGVNQDLGVFALPAGAPGDFLPLATYVQVAHLAPFAADASVTVRLNGADALTDFDYGDSTAYIALEQGTYLVEIVPTGTTTVAISATVDLAQATYYTAIATGDGVNQDLALIALVDDLTAPAAGNFKLRLGHLAPFDTGTATADIRLQDGTPVLTDVVYSAVAPYLELPAGTYNLIITTPGGGTILIDPEPVTFADGDIVSAFATGEGTNQALGVFALPAGEVGFFLPLED
jgi:minor extracellular serine protease Vpr